MRTIHLNLIDTLNIPVILIHQSIVNLLLITKMYTVIVTNEPIDVLEPYLTTLKPGYNYRIDADLIVSVELI